MGNEKHDELEVVETLTDPGGTVHTSSMVSESGSPTFNNVTSGLDTYTLSGMGTKQDMWMAALGFTNDALRGVPIVRYEYYDGSSWVSWSPSNPGYINDGNPSNTFTFDDTHSHFRVTFDFGTWNRIFALGISWGWGNGTYTNDYDLKIERSADDTDGSYSVQQDYGTVGESGYQDIHLGLGEQGDQYLRVEINLHNVGTDDTPGIKGMPMFTYDPGTGMEAILSVGDRAQLFGELEANGWSIVDEGTTVWESTNNHVPASSVQSSGLDSDSVDGYDIYVQSSAPSTSDPYIRFEP